jgi:hypothetical protein
MRAYIYMKSVILKFISSKFTFVYFYRTMFYKELRLRENRVNHLGAFRNPISIKITKAFIQINQFTLRRPNPLRP